MNDVTGRMKSDRELLEEIQDAPGRLLTVVLDHEPDLAGRIRAVWKLAGQEPFIIRQPPAVLVGGLRRALPGLVASLKEVVRELHPNAAVVVRGFDGQLQQVIDRAVAEIERRNVTTRRS